MIPIHTALEFEPVLSAQNAIVFIHGEWAAPSVKSFEYVEAWLASIRDRTEALIPNVYCAYLPRMQHEYLTEWIDQNPLLQFRNEAGHLVHLGCGGTIAWVVFGNVMQSAMGALKLNFDELSERTKEAFGPR